MKIQPEIKEEDTAQWWRGAMMYQIYPRSFLDTNNDGIGDLKGITAKLDYLAGLGIEGLWISPFFKSPMKDYGYDVSDYRDVDPLFGTLADFQTLLEKAHLLGLKIIIDLVLSHTSDQHPWFHDPAKKDWYVWADAKTGTNTKEPPNNWVSVFGGSAWEWHEGHRQYYFHNFLKEQPDLNFHNPEVQKEALDIARFWLNMGVDGFRLDVCNFYFHDWRLRDNPARLSGTQFATQYEGEDPYSAQQHIHDKSQPENLTFLRQLRALTDEYAGKITQGYQQERFMVGELGDDHPYARAAEYTAGETGLHTTYNTHLMSGAHKALSPEIIREPFALFAAEPGDGWPSWAFSNHDVVRAVSRWHNAAKAGDEGFSQDPALAKMLIALLGCLRGTMFLYQGDELGLPEIRMAFEDIQDPWGKHLWPAWQGRDGCRTPMPWTGGEHGGFSAHKPWLPVSELHKALNVAAQDKDQSSVLNFTRAFLKWRQTQPPLIRGEITFHASENNHILTLSRSLEGKTILCQFNLSDASQALQTGDSPDKMLYSDELSTQQQYAPYGFTITAHTKENG
ncbi:MAG: alpha glucosidase [Alphaproteobacteria bacterium]|nr:alpha glucosidase [Alphaproteobacteria bacterium]